MSKRTVYPPERKVQKILIAIPKDQIALIDDCARAMGMSRSAFLQVYFDSYSEQVVTFVEGWLTGIKYYLNKVGATKRLSEAKTAAKTLGMALTDEKSPKP